MPTLGSSVTLENDAWTYQDAVGTVDARYVLGAFLETTAGHTGIYRNGRMPSGDWGTTDATLLVKPGSTGLSVVVGSGHWAVDTGAGNGPYVAFNASDKTLALVASASTTSRIDLVIARIWDDQNSAIGSPSGTRQVTIEVWTGDPSSGTPTQPTPNIAAGWIPLAAVTVAPNASSITTDKITDLRGPVLVSRGGVRPLYGADARLGSSALAEQGSYPGARRWVHGPGLQDQAWYGAGNGGWRGVSNRLVYSAAPAPGGDVWVKGLNATREICRLTIPDPGVPYAIEATARVFLNISPWVAADVRITLDSVSGPDVNWCRVDTMGDVHDRRKVPNVAPLAYGPITGARDVVLSVANRDIYQSDPSLWGFSYAGNDTAQNILSVSVFPSFTQPAAP